MFSKSINGVNNGHCAVSLAASILWVAAGEITWYGET